MSLGPPTMLATLALIPAAIAWWSLWRARRPHQPDAGAEVAGARRVVSEVFLTTQELAPRFLLAAGLLILLEIALRASRWRRLP